MDTHGWDTVCVCATDQVNVGLRQHLSGLHTGFAYSDGLVSFEGTFGPWQVVPGGSAKTVRFQTPVTSGELVLLGQSYDLAGILPELDLQLAFVENQTASDVRDLVFDFRVSGSGPGDTTPGAVTTITPDASGAVPSSSPAWGALHDLLPQLLIANQEKLAYVFASVNLVPPGAASWLAPKAFDYVYVQPVAGGSGYLAVLAVVTPRDTSALPRVVDTSLLDGAHALYFLISPGLFLANVVLPTLPAAYGHGAALGSFAVQDAAVRNTGPLDCGSFREGLIDYYPHLDSLSISVDGNQLRSSASGAFDITGLTEANVTFSLGATNTCTYDPSGRTLSFAADPDPRHDYQVNIPDWERWIGAIGGPVVLGIVYGVTTAVTSSVADSVSSSLGAGADLSIASAAPVAVAWPGLSAFDVQDAGLADGFYLRGAFATSVPAPPHHSHW